MLVIRLEDSEKNCSDCSYSPSYCTKSEECKNGTIGYIVEGEEAVKKVTVAPLDRQEGGNHYKDDYVIQPIEFLQKNKIPPCEANIVKYVCRHRKKGGKGDLLKAKHYLEILLEMEYGGE